MLKSRDRILATPVRSGENGKKHVAVVMFGSEMMSGISSAEKTPFGRVLLLNDVMATSG